jgi:hypothetical protein
MRSFFYRLDGIYDKIDQYLFDKVRIHIKHQFRIFQDDLHFNAFLVQRWLHQVMHVLEQVAHEYMLQVWRCDLIQVAVYLGKLQQASLLLLMVLMPTSRSSTTPLLLSRC